MNDGPARMNPLSKSKDGWPINSGDERVFAYAETALDGDLVYAACPLHPATCSPTLVALIDSDPIALHHPLPFLNFFSQMGIEYCGR